MTIHEKLAAIQSSLHVPKGERNDFGKYNYRTAEGILQAVKPLLNGATLTLSDDVIEVGGRVYVKANVTLTSDGESVTVSALAREAVTRKGMDDSQITGTASSYARKYAMNGLFAIDNTADADTMDNSKQNDPDAAFNDAVAENIESLKAIRDGISSANLSAAAEAWFELDKPTMAALWRAPSKGGWFTTDERSTMQTKEFREAHFGVSD